jgi:hypothetical protein
VILSGLFFEKELISEEKLHAHELISAVGKLKSYRFQDWINERHSDAQIISTNLVLADLLHSITQANENKEEVKNKVISYLRTILNSTN